MRNKLFRGIIAATLGVAMTAGFSVGLANGLKKVMPAYAAAASSSSTAPNDATYSYTFASGDLPVAGATKTFNEISWTYSGDTHGSNTYVGFDSTKGVQIGKGTSGFGATTDMTLTAAVESFGVNKKVTKMAIGLACASSGGYSGSLSSGDTISSSTTSVLYWSSAAMEVTSGDIVFTFKSTNSAKAIYVKAIYVWYQNNGGNPDPSITFTEDEISGEVGDDFSFTWSDNDLTNPITWSPSSGSTDIIDYEVNTGTKTVSGTLLKAGSVTLTATSGDASDSVDFVVREHEINRKYTVTSKTEVSGSGDTITGASASYSQTFNTASQATSGNSMTLNVTGLTKKVTINKLVLSMHSNGSAGAGSISVKIDNADPVFIAGTSDSSGAGFNTFGDNTSYGSTYRDVTWDNLNYLAKKSIEIKIYCIATNSLYCQSFDIFFSEEDNNDVVTSLSVTPNTWSGYNTSILSVSSFEVSVLKNSSAGTLDDYEFQGIGTGEGDGFIARVSDFTSGHPDTSDTRLQWKANYPTTPGGSTYLYAYVSLTVSEDGISSVALEGDLDRAVYSTLDSWDAAGLTVNAIYASSNEVDVTASSSFKFYRDSSLTNEVAKPSDLGVGADQTVYVKVTYLTFSNASGYSQTVTINEPKFNKVNSLENGKRYIIAARGCSNEDELYYLPAATTTITKNPVSAQITSFMDLTKANTWKITIDAESHITISNRVENNTYYLTATNTAQGISVKTTNDGYWTLDENGLSYNDVGSRYLSTYDNASFRYYGEENPSQIFANIFYEFVPSSREVIEDLETQSWLSYAHYYEDEGAFTFDRLGLRFGGLVDVDLYDSLSPEGYGILLAPVSSLGNHTIEYYYKDAKTNENSVEDAISAMCTAHGITNFSNSHTRHEPEKKDTPSMVGDDYSWKLHYGIADDALTTAYAAVAYILIDGDIIFLQEERASAKSLANEMINITHECESDAYGGSLNYIATKE